MMWAKAKKEIKAGTAREKLEIFTEEQLADAEWEHSMEFFLGEEKYDVMRKTVVDGKTLYHCINDKREQELKNKLDLGKKHNKIFEDIIKKICLQTPPAQQIEVVLNTCGKHYSDFTEGDYHSKYHSESFRPPITLIG